MRFVLFMLAFTLTLPAHAAPEPVARWQAALAALEVMPDACAEVLAARFARELGDTSLVVTSKLWSGTPLVRLTAPPDPDPFAVLNANGGLPYVTQVGRSTLVRLPSKLEDSVWSPISDTSIAFNRGLALIDAGAGHQLLVFDHTDSPVTAATSIWELVGKRGIERGVFKGEISATELRDGLLILHADDPLSGAQVAWDPKQSALVGQCFVDVDALAFADITIPSSLIASTPTPLKLTGMKHPLLRMTPSAEAPKPDRIGWARPNVPGVTLLTRPDGYSLVLVPNTAANRWTKLFRRGNAWVIGWLAP